MEGFILVQLHENIVNSSTNVDGIYLSYPSGDKINFYIDKNGEGYWVTPRTLAALVGQYLSGISIAGKTITPWVKINSMTERLKSLIHLLDTVPEILSYKNELNQVLLDVCRSLGILADYGVLSTTTDTDLIWYHIPTLPGIAFALVGGTSQENYAVLRHGEIVWALTIDK